MYPPEQLFKPMSVDDLPYDIKISGDGIEPAKSQCDISKPTRPLTAYHVYFQLEREFIIQGSQCTDNDNNEIVKDTRPVGIELDPEMPLRYHNIHICRTWYTTGKEKRLKRKHRKTHGKIAFLDLSKTIAARWATLEETDPETKNYCNKIAKRELEVYKEKVKVYKASIADDPIGSLPSSFSSSAPPSPTFDFSALSRQASLSIASPNSNSAASFQVCHDFHPEWMDKDDEPLATRPAKWARSSVPIATVANTDSVNNSRANSDPLSEWCPDSLSVQIGKGAEPPLHSASMERTYTAGAITNMDTNESAADTCNGAGGIPTSMSAEPVENEFSFHPVPCDSEDFFLKKYRKLARRTSLFSIRPLHHQVAPFSQSFNGEVSKGKIELNGMMECENTTNEPKRLRGFSCIQRKLRSELDERVSRAINVGWGRKNRVQPAADYSIDGNMTDAYVKTSGKKRLSSSISNSNET